MSTQRREDLWQRRSCTERGGGTSQFWFALLAWFVRAIARVGTAPPQAVFKLPAARLATNSLQSGHRNTQLDRQEICLTSPSSPPLRAGRSATTGTPATRRSSLPLIPPPSVLERLHLSLPHRGSPISLTGNHLVAVSFS